MLEMIDIEIDHSVAFRISGKVTESDMSLVLTEAKEKIESHGDIVLLEQIDSFDGIEIAAVIEEFKYLFEVGISNITKVAVLTDNKWLETIVNIEDTFFRHIKMKCFATKDKEAAIEFLKESEFKQ
jgi:stage II sporulation SpoAA-like protein